ncbi:type II secretion/transformation system, E protein [Aliarcobacter faecis]|uniref:GspE/PulE family protein n=1 Tax=Aliarcobacter faecis TaxID=1564138 RepID=UPI00047B67BB|nr:GspE/PulE family protein [Aliarcobacter faecis]QKF73895.1 type II secretion/transformation system, E protein [Aliarcobacter faecis]
MQNILKTLINYSLFTKYEKGYFIKNRVVPILEDSISLKLAVCKSSNLQTIKDDFSKILNFVEVNELDILFLLSNLEIKIELFLILQKINSGTDSYIKEFVEKILLFAIEKRASDMHIEKFENRALFKFRVDGKLKIFFVIEFSYFSQISSYLKLLSNLDITQIRLPLDGRFSLNIRDKKYDFRFSSMPTIEAESLVLRVLDSKNIDKSLQTLGLSQNIYEILINNLQISSGLILISGPTGSGKTTTLYSILKELNSEDKKIITIEDPVEYKIPSINQIPVNSKIGLSFELALKNILRQDPDIIFIGEIRDKFSLDIALQASLTGHLVLASIHANSSLETITRLLDLKADPFLIATSLKLVMAQRLVLNYCIKCASNGCSFCNFTKYYERSSIAEILKIDDELSSLIFKKSNKQEFLNYLKSINFQTLKDDGMLKVRENKTSKEEVLKVVNI